MNGVFFTEDSPAFSFSGSPDLAELTEGGHAIHEKATDDEPLSYKGFFLFFLTTARDKPSLTSLTQAHLRSTAVMT